jgi:hypothetical protein
MILLTLTSRNEDLGPVMALGHVEAQRLRRELSRTVAKKILQIVM